MTDLTSFGIDESTSSCDGTMTTSNTSKQTNGLSEDKEDDSTNVSEDPLNSSNYFACYDALKDLCTNNVEYFQTDDSENGQRFYCAYMGFIDHIDSARKYVETIKEFAHEYDFNKATPGNGYRSFLLVVRSCINHGLKLSSYVMQNRSSLLFRKSLYIK